MRKSKTIDGKARPVVNGIWSGGQQTNAINIWSRLRQRNHWCATQQGERRDNLGRCGGQEGKHATVRSRAHQADLIKVDIDLFASCPPLFPDPHIDGHLGFLGDKFSAKGVEGRWIEPAVIDIPADIDPVGDDPPVRAPPNRPAKLDAIAPRVEFAILGCGAADHAF